MRKVPAGYLFLAFEIGLKLIIMGTNNGFLSNNKNFSFISLDQFFLMVLIILKFFV